MVYHLTLFLLLFGGGGGGAGGLENPEKISSNKSLLSG